jgi:hypothetical protein
MKNNIEFAGFAGFGVGLCVTVFLVSPGFTPDALPVAITVGLCAFAVSLACLAVSAMWSRWPMAPAAAVVRPRPDHETSARPQGGA